jgi:polyhydroxyalkanoate synthesis regulator phasin
MNPENLLALSERLHAIVSDTTDHDLFGSQLHILQHQHGIDAPHHLSEALDAMDSAERLLNIGFVGRVKAGKSSLLNALFFEGQNVLPKAATPMTAALTTLTYGEHFAAEVEFFSADDQQHIRMLASDYEQQYLQRLARHTADILKRRERNGEVVDGEAVRRLAERQATMEMKSVIALAAAHEQVQLMQASEVDGSTLGTTARLAASNPQALVEQLKHYVGAGGSFMPFTKIVNVYMPLAPLKDIRVIDTPGTNDPVVSREERTVALLKRCDVVFVVSPAGQFLNEDDLNLLNRITLKEGVQELALVASQVDSQLHDSEKRARLDDALNSVRDNLSAQAKRNLTELTRQNPEGTGVFQALLGSMQDGVLHSAGICLTLEKSLSTPLDQWGDEERTAWDNLEESYPDYFNLDDPDRARVSLAKLSNIVAIERRLEEVRSRKHIITEQKRAALIKRKAEGLEAYRKALVQMVQSQIMLVKNANISELQGQLCTLRTQKMKLEHELDLTYKQCVHEYRTHLRSELMSGANRALRASTDQVSSAHEVESYKQTVDKQGGLNWMARKLWGGGTESVPRKKQTVMTGQVQGALDKFIADVEELLNTTCKTARGALDKQLGKALAPAVERVLKDDCNPELVYRALADVVRSLDDTPFQLEIRVPRELQARKTLEDNDARDYFEKAEDFVAQLGNKTESRIRQFLDRLETSLPATVSKTFVDALTEQVDALESQVLNSAQTVDRLERIARGLEGTAR